MKSRHDQQAEAIEQRIRQAGRVIDDLVRWRLGDSLYAGFYRWVKKRALRRELETLPRGHQRRLLRSLQRSSHKQTRELARVLDEEIGAARGLKEALAQEAAEQSPTETSGEVVPAAAPRGRGDELAAGE
jgi:hypothetical protein